MCFPVHKTINLTHAIFNTKHVITNQNYICKLHGIKRMFTRIREHTRRADMQSDRSIQWSHGIEMNMSHFFQVYWKSRLVNGGFGLTAMRQPRVFYKWLNGFKSAKYADYFMCWISSNSNIFSTFELYDDYI